MVTGGRWVAIVTAVASTLALSSGCAGAKPQTAQTSPIRVLEMPAVVVAVPSSQQILQGVADSVLAAPAWRNARWGILMVDAASGDTIVSRDAGRLFMPASNQKLLTAAIALQALGPDHQWRTPVLLHGRQLGSTFAGNLLVAGSGDPSISDALRGGSAASAFDGIIPALAARGIRTITGRVMAVGDAFEGSTTGYGWAADDFDEPYSAAVDELLYNEGQHTVHVIAGATAGARVRVRQAPTNQYPPLQVTAVTRAVGTSGTPLRAAYDSTGLVIGISGSLQVGDSIGVTVAYRHPTDAFTAALAARLAEAGVRIRHRFLAVDDTARRDADTLHVIVSAPFADVLRRMQKSSQNQIAELLFRTAGRAMSGVGTADSARAVAARTLLSWGVSAQDATYRDGSGLSRHNYVTPEAIVRVLDTMRRSPWFALYRDALPIAGVDGTMANRLRNSAAAGNVRAKTGTLDKARSLSGYVHSADGRLVMFSLLANNFSLPAREVERVQELLLTLVSGTSLGAVRAVPGHN